MSRKLVFCGALAAVFGTACTEARGVDRAGMEHGLSIDDRIEPTRLSCRDGRERVIGSDDAVEVITFATPYDCVFCSVHLSGVLALVDQLPQQLNPPVLVLWSPSDIEIERAIGKIENSGFELCQDVEGNLWDRYNLANTPFTIVLRDGVVVYLSDRALDGANGEQFLTDIRNLATDVH